MANAKTSVFTFVIYYLLVYCKNVHCGLYLGKFLGKLSELHHGVSGEVYAVDRRTLHIKDFTYDGQGPAAYFWAGNTRAVGPQGFRIRDENGRPEVLRRYRKEGVTLTLPEGKTLNSIKWFSVWCEEFEVNFGDVKIPRNFEYPRPQKIDALRGVHGISSENIVVVDAQTLLIPSLSYDGEAPDAKFWAGRGSKPSPQGIRIPDENGKELPLRRYDHKTIVLTLPRDMTVFDIGHFGIWCEAFTVDFGHVQLPQNLNIPPSLKMLGISPQSKLNCEVLYDDLAFEVRWAVAGDGIVLQLVSKLEDREYMSFGLSGDDRKNVMIGGDVAVVWMDKNTLKGYAEDYYLKDKSQCSGPTGSCPDERILKNTNNVRLLNAATVNGYTIITYQRPLRASDILDKPILTNESQAIIWAIGPLNQRNEVSFHRQYSKRDTFLHFGRPAKWNCPMPEGDQPVVKAAQISPQKTVASSEEVQDYSEVPKPTPSRTRNGDRRRGQNNISSERGQVEKKENSRVPSRNNANPAPVSKRNAWVIPPIQCNEPEDGVFYAQMGPTGGKRGYEAITGHVGWGISWYINGLLIPEINLIRGKTYTFVVEGGFNKEIPAKYHPFYITDDPIGGYEYKTPEERPNVRIFAGAIKRSDGTIEPTGIGRLCHWTHQGDSDAEDFASFGAYQRTLELKCDQGEPGVIQWTPDRNTPDTVYYQCFTHRQLGWKINVLDECDLAADGSEVKPLYAHPYDGTLTSIDSDTEDIEASPSIRVETRIKPNNLAFDNIQATPSILAETKIKPNNAEFNSKTIPDLNLKSKVNITENTYQNRPNVFRQSFNSVQRPLALLYNEYPTLAPFQIDLHNSDYNFDGSQRLPTTVILVTPHKNVHEGEKLITRPRTIINKNYMDLYKNAPTVHKKPYYKTYLKMPAFHGHTMANYPNYQINTQGNKSSIAILKESAHVEISPQQASTQRDPDIQATLPDLLPAINTGFHPESIVIEGGFRPLIHKGIEHRLFNKHGPELESESAIGVINVEKRNEDDPEDLKPEFMPSFVMGLGKETINKINKRRANPKSSIRSSSQISTDDEMTEAAERVESYYLPPESRKPVQRERPSQPSNIDIPPGIVVTYDGKKVSGASLTIQINDKASGSNSRSSKATELIKSSPQFAPFKGELPPLQPIINPDAPQLKLRGVISRDLDTPDLPPPTGPTRLLPIKPEKKIQSRNTRVNGDSS